ncbi:hypothetical protein CHUUTOTORO_02400 [Serratia phage vB_SmaM-ChuuTotoro]|nr:hypothetical protein CHUUTOTORO_02400 [Serratia phage vB_SmaM-ChuuTotoro]
MMSRVSDLSNHTVALPGNAPALIAYTKEIAVDAAERMYGEDWREKGVVVRKTDNRDFELFLGRRVRD